MAAIQSDRGHLPRAAASYAWQVTLHCFEQHSDFDPQDDPFDLQGWHTLARQLPEQQVSPDGQDNPFSVQQPLLPLHSPL
jgi:hypothetical protein